MTDAFNDNGWIAVALHTSDKATELCRRLEGEGIRSTIRPFAQADGNAGCDASEVMIHPTDLARALRLIENHEIFASHNEEQPPVTPSYILVPVDFSEHSVATVCAAAKIAAAHKVPLRFINSYIDPYASGEGIQLADDMTYDIVDADARQKIAADAKKNMDDFVHTVKQLMKSGDIEAVKIATEVVEGVPEDVINGYAKSNPPLLTVMATRSSSQKERDMIGSVTAEVLDGSRHPVLAFPHPALPPDDVEIRRILFFTDNEEADTKAMDTLRDLLPPSRLSVTVVVLPSRRRWIARPWANATPSRGIQKYFSSHYPEWEFETVHADTGSPVDDMTALHREHHYDLIVIPSKRSRNILNRMFHPTLAHQLIFRADVPLLVIPV